MNFCACSSIIDGKYILVQWDQVQYTHKQNASSFLSMTDGLQKVNLLCIHFCVMINITQSTTVLITRGQLVMRHVYIIYIYFPKVGK